MKAVGVLLLFCVLAGCGVSVWAEATATDSAVAAQTDAVAEVESVSDAEVEAEAAAEVEAAAEAEAESDAEAEADISAEAEGELQSQAELDAAHENAVATLEQYAEKAHALRDEIISSEHSLMEQMAAIDSCPPSQLSGLMARAKKQITHLFQIKALYLAIKQQEKQLRALLDNGTGKRAPSVAPKKPAPAAPKAAAPKPAAAKPATTLAPAEAASLNAMNAKLVAALARLETVSARLATVERRQGKGKKATLVIAAQMEKDEKRLNKHSRVLRRLRSGQRAIKKALRRLAKSCRRGKRAEGRIRKARRGGSRKARKAKAAKAKKAKAGKKVAKKGGKKPAAKKANGKRKGKGKGKKVTRKARAFNVNKCYARCAKSSERRQSHCVRACRKKAARRAAAKRKGKGKGKGKKARRSPALKKCLAQCRKANPIAKRAAAKKCAVSCFRRHMHRGKQARRTRGRRGVARKGKGKGKAKKAFNLKGCLAKCPRSKKNAKRRSRRCTRSCYRAARAARGTKRRSNPKLKACFKTCRKGKKWNRKCVRACRAKHAKKGKGKGKGRNSKKLKACFKTCRGKPRVVLRRNKKTGKTRRVRVKGAWNMPCVKSCRKRFGSKGKGKKWNSKKLKACFKTCRGKPRVVLRRNKKTGKSRRVRVKGAWNMPCVKSCRKRFGKPKSKKAKKANPQLKKCYQTCKKGKKVRGRKQQWDMKCVRRCRSKFGRKAKKAPKTAAYAACLKRCRKGKGYRKCRKACAKHNRPAKLPKIKSPSSKAVAAALKGLKKPKKAKKSKPETWEDVVRQSRRLLKKTVRLRDLVHKQVARHFDTKDVEGRKYNGWWSIYDVLKGLKPGKHYTSRAKEIDADVKQILAPALDKAAASKYGEVVNVLKAADESNASKYTRELGSPALNLAVDKKFNGYVEKPLPGAKIRHVPYNPLKPYDASEHVWHKTPPLSRLPELRDETYDENLTPIYARQFKIARKAPAPEQPFDLATKNWDYPQIPYSYPVTMVSHNPKYKNPHVRPPTPGFHADWPEFRFQQTATSADAEAEATAPPAPAAAAATAAPAAAAAPADAAQQPMTEGTNDA